MSPRRDVVQYPNDAGLRVVLRSLQVSPDALLGHGGEAWVYRLDETRVIRVLHEGQDPEAILERQALVDELRAGGAAFALPELLELHEIDARHFTIERRLPGVPVSERLQTLEGRARTRLIENYLAAAAALARLHLRPRGWFGDLVGREPVRAATWSDYLRHRAARSLRLAGPAFASVDAVELAAGLPDCDRPAFVHLDAFAGNMLAVGTEITAVLDIGATSAVGDPRLDPLASAVYLSAPEITPAATHRDIDVALKWLETAGLRDWFEPARRWLAAFWSSAVDDEKLHSWCRSTLIGDV